MKFSGGFSFFCFNIYYTNMHQKKTNNDFYQDKLLLLCEFPYRQRQCGSIFAFRVKQSYMDYFRLKHKFAGSFIEESLVMKKKEKQKTVKRKKKLQLYVTFSEFAEAIYIFGCCRSHRQPLLTFFALACSALSNHRSITAALYFKHFVFIYTFLLPVLVLLLSQMCT